MVNLDYREEMVRRDGMEFLAKKARMLQYRSNFYAEIQDIQDNQDSKEYKEIAVLRESLARPRNTSQTVKVTRAIKEK